ncbi:MAG: hypothetical protein AB2776_19450 [Candidatus Thiodiazotropha endolucinida]
MLRDRKQRKKVMPGHDENGYLQAAIKTGWMARADDLPEVILPGCFGLSFNSEIRY